jgi:TonB-dependent starch-binding outer membrane protein SusC
MKQIYGAGKHIRINSVFHTVLRMGFILAILFACTGTRSAFAENLQSGRISGKVFSVVDRQPIVGATVVLKGTTVGSITDIEGNFSIDAKTGDVLIFSFIGFQTQEVLVSTTSGIEVMLREDVTDIDEVVVVGYGVQKKKLITGATSQVSGDDLSKQNTTNALHAMQGSTPGVQITSASGQPGKGVNVTIRGLGSIYGGNPLYLVDGVITGDISYLNPSDIESIDILKDAASAAIYGAQASNGVVLVTTRSGSKKSSKISFDAFYGVQNIAKKIELLDADKYALIMNEQAINSGNSPLYPATGKAAFLDQYENNNWFDEITVENAPIYDYTLGLNGGSESSIYSMSLGLSGQDGVIGGHDVSSFQRVNFRINTEHEMYDGFLKMGQHLTYSQTNSTGVNEGNLYSGSPIRSALGTSPFLPMFDDAGNFLNNSAGKSTDNGTVWSPWEPGEANPYAQMQMGESHSTNQKIFGDVYAEISPLRGLRIKTVLGIDAYNSGSRSFMPVYQLSMYSYNNNDFATQNLGKGQAWSWDNTASYDFDVNNHTFNVLVGSSMREYQGEWMHIRNADLVLSDYEHAWINNTTNTANSTLWSFQGAPNEESKMLSFFGRMSYNYKETYMATATFRADGSSRFAANNRWGYFPSVSAGWVMTNEDFLKDASLIDFLKLRASWGQVGNQNIPAWKYLATIQTSDAYYYFGQGVPAGSLTAPGSELNVPGSFPNQLGNSKLKWETSEQTNIGIDARFLNSRLGVNLDLYNKITKDWLISAPVLVTSGAETSYINGGDVTNRGVELALNWNERSKPFQYSVNANVAYNHNKVGNIPTEDGIVHGNGNEAYNNADPAYRRAQEGFPIGYFWGWKTDGILQNQAEVAEYVASLGGSAGSSLQGRSIAPGDVRYVDNNGDKKINEADKTMIGNPNPDFTFGLSFSCSYKGFDFSLVGNGVAGNEIFQSYRNYGSKTANYTTAILDRWHGEGTSNKLPRVTETNINYRISDLFVHKGDFFRISNLQVGYDFAPSFKLKNLSQLRLYVAVQNAYTFTSYNGMDPEVGYGTDSSTSGIDLGFYPRPRTLLTGINIKF